MQNTTKIIRSVNSSKHNFTPISNNLLKNENLSLESKGLLCYIISLPENWTIYKTQVMKILGMARHKFDRIWKECADNGYITTHKFRDGNGKFSYYYEVTDNVDFTDVGKTGIGSTGIGKSGTIIKKEEEKIEGEKKEELEIDSISLKLNSLKSRRVKGEYIDFNTIQNEFPSLSAQEQFNLYELI